MTNPPTTCATEPADGGDFSPLPDYFTFGNSNLTQIEDENPLDPDSFGDVYLSTKGTHAGENLVAPEADGDNDDVVTFGGQAMWEQGAITMASLHNSRATPSPTSQCEPPPLVSGITGFGPILTTWPEPSIKKSEPSMEEPADKQHQSKRKKSTAGGLKEKEKEIEKANTATGRPQSSPGTVTTLPPQDSIAVKLDNPDDEASKVATPQEDDGSKSTNEQFQSQSQPSGQEGADGTQLATQRARNRVAANRFRKKSKAAVEELEAFEKALSAHHEQLSAEVRELRDEVLNLKTELLMHGDCNCDTIQQYLNNAARNLSIGAGARPHRPSLGYLPTLTPSSQESSNGPQ